MKSLVLLAILAVSAQTFATSLAPLECSSGTMGEDNYVSVSMLNGAVEFQMHETFIAASPAETKVTGNTLVIVNKTLKGNAEGDEFTAKTNARLVYRRSRNTLKVTLVLDGNRVLSGRTLKCK